MPRRGVDDQTTRPLRLQPKLRCNAVAPRKPAWGRRFQRSAMEIAPRRLGESRDRCRGRRWRGACHGLPADQGHGLAEIVGDSRAGALLQHGSNPRDVERAPGARHFFLRGKAATDIEPTTAWGQHHHRPFPRYGRDGAGGFDFWTFPRGKSPRGGRRRSHVADEHAPRCGVEAPNVINDLIINGGLQREAGCGTSNVKLRNSGEWGSFEFEDADVE